MAPKAADALEARRLEPTLSRPWAAPTTAWSIPTRSTPSDSLWQCLEGVPSGIR